MFKQYRRKAIAELRPLTPQELAGYINPSISISEADRLAGSPKQGDMVARNPLNPNDMWLVAAQYFNDNFEEF